ETSGLLQRFEGTLGSAEISTKQKQNRRVSRERIFCFALKTSMGGRGISVEVRRRMRQRCLARAIRKILRHVVSARIQDGEAKICTGVRLHRYSSGLEGGGGVGRKIDSPGISSLG